MNFKKIVVLLLALITVFSLTLSISSCGKDEKDANNHAEAFIDRNGNGFCDECGDILREFPCDEGMHNINKQGYCRACGFFCKEYENYEIEHKNHTDKLHGDGRCDMCGDPVDSSAWGEFSKKIDLFWRGFIVKEGYKEVLRGLLVTLEIAIFGLIIGIVLGTLIALVKVMPKGGVVSKILNVICDIYVGFFRGTPMVVQLLIGYFVLLPSLGIAADGVVVAIVIFGLNSGAYVSEIMRAGINSVDKGQLEAGRAVGLPFWTAMLKIVIPQSIKNILPTLGNEFIVLVKETSVVSFIAVVDVTKAFKSIADANYEYLIPYVALALVYLVLVMVITLGIKLMERRLGRNDRKS